MIKTEGRNNVLVIDDDPNFRELMAVIGELCSVPVLGAADCCQGLRVLTRYQSKIKMVLLDYLMPGMDPIACAEAILEKAGPEVPVVLVTAAVDPSDQAARMRIGRWISKPVEVSVLTDLLTENNLTRR
jgi:CheY-like chemotaxis protein